MSWLVLSFPRPAAAEDTGPRVVLHLTDFGIGQPESTHLPVGSPFQSGYHRLLPDSMVPPEGRLLLPMPSDDVLARLTPEEAARSWASALRSRIDLARENGVREFEIQLVQNVSRPGYAAPRRQARVRKFGKLAYKAIATLVTDLSADGIEPVVDATLGSNGTVAFAESVDSWTEFHENIRRVTMVDGRAGLGAVARAIETLGQRKVRIVNTLGDLWGPSWSISNFNAVRRLKRTYPGITALLVEPLDADKRFGDGRWVRPLSSHVLTMVDPTSRFLVREADFDGAHSRLLRLGELTARELHDPGPDLDRLREQAQSRRAYDAPGARFAEDLEDLADLLEVTEALLGFVKDLGVGSDLPKEFSLIRASVRDLAAQAEGKPLSVASSHLLEQLGKVGLERVGDLLRVLADQGKIPKIYGALPGTLGLEDFVAGTASAAGKGRIGIDEWTHYLDGFSKLTASIAAGLTVYSLLAPVLGPEGGRRAAGEAAARMSSAVGNLQVVGRTATSSWFRKWANSPVQKTMLQQWTALQRRRLADGLPLLTLREMFTEEVLRQAGFSREAIDEWDRDIRWKNEVVRGADGLIRLELEDRDRQPFLVLSVVGMDSIFDPSPDASRAASGPGEKSRDERADGAADDEAGEDDCESSECPPDDGDDPLFIPCPFPPCVDWISGRGPDGGCPDGSLPPCDRPGGDDDEDPKPPPTPASIEIVVFGYTALWAGLYPEANAAFASISGDDSEEFRAWTEAWLAAPKHGLMAWVLEADSLVRRGDFEGALASLANADRSGPSGFVSDVRGMIHALRGDSDAAAREFETAVRLDPDLVDAMVNRAAIQVSNGDLPAAIALLSKALALEPNHAGAYNVRGVAHSLQGSWKEAEADFTASRRTGSSGWRTHVDGNVRLMERLEAESSLAANRGGASPRPAVGSRLFVPRGGVIMAAEVERKPRADFSEMFGVRTSREPAPDFFLTPLAAFSSLAAADRPEHVGSSRNRP